MSCARSVASAARRSVERAVHHPARPRRGAAHAPPARSPGRDGGSWPRRSRTVPGRDESPDWRMRQALRTLLDHETRGLGRIAGSSVQHRRQADGADLSRPARRTSPGDQHPLRTLLGRPDQAVSPARSVRRLTVIDPLVGSSGAGRPERPAGLHRDPGDRPGRPRTASRCCGLAADDVRLIEGYSTEPGGTGSALGPELRRRGRGRGSLRGGRLRRTCAGSETLVAPGGVVVMDDFGDPAWAGVERATRRTSPTVVGWSCSAGSPRPPTCEVRARRQAAASSSS